MMARLARRRARMGEGTEKMIVETADLHWKEGMRVVSEREGVGTHVEWLAERRDYSRLRDGDLRYRVPIFFRLFLYGNDFFLHCDGLGEDRDGEV